VKRVSAEILSIGSELLIHGRLDSNAGELGQRLAGHGFRVDRRATVGDELETLTAAFREAAGRAALVLSTGGLGPTSDDITRQAVAAAFGCELRLDPAILPKIEARFRALGRAMPQSNRRQAELPVGAESLPNDAGTAPGVWLEHPGGLVIALPGPPHEMRAVLSTEVMERILHRLRPPAVAQRALQVAGVPESDLEDRIADLYGAEAGAEVTVLARAGQIEILVLVRNDDPERARAGADRLCERISERLGDAVFAGEPTTLAASVGERLRRAGATLAVAESCTGGLLGAELTSAPGSSDYFLGGVIAYGNRIKQDLLGVSAETLARSGAVSEETARAMAEGVRARFGSDYAIAVTGVAGPDGGSAEKPVGRIYLAVAAGDGVDVHRHDFRGDRERVRRWTVGRALDRLRRRLDRSAGEGGE